MGQEWAASTPFYYFTDHHHQLGRHIHEGRLTYLNHLYPGHDYARAPAPQHIQTFLDSKLRWDERPQPAHACTLRLYRDLISYRPCSGGPFTVERLAPHALALRRAESLLIVNLRGPLEWDLSRETAIHPILDTEDPTYGGQGQTRLAGSTLYMSGPAALLLTAQPCYRQIENA